MYVCISLARFLSKLLQILPTASAATYILVHIYTHMYVRRHIKYVGERAKTKNV